ncbi:DUF5994 family protein [Amycolatopsis acidiphila]|uniref:Uncharacterized protein n=1 Tax=Amycolatopsis acidiphila TaxID=715473 RepID=A0A557ZYU2_9PSEU|nr:DUF5994 family protein [Amycolatopsis acidiphila]TVT17167.1 hypothetical protein FNH06_32455 [Amycolatopsis acidiphila]UIJ63073.1 DUF5994 family protein [Amycolatopsis acidiphila]GHG65971.1 hypothetical protein GCM10017788_23870 [Amycolatopsis acidiphila]
MTSGPHTHTTTPQTPVTGPPPPPLRLRLRPTAPAADQLDGGWWPRSRDLAAELPALAEGLSTRLGHVTGVAFAVGSWDPAPPRVEVDGHVVRLEGLREQDENVVRVSGPDRQRLNLLVVPPDATGTTGDNAMSLASLPVEADQPAEILAVSGAQPAPLFPSGHPERDLGTRRSRPRIRTRLARDKPS